nr:MAG TPA: hypothetical protein [Herelleviridae sp.]
MYAMDGQKAVNTWDYATCTVITIIIVHNV